MERGDIKRVNILNNPILIRFLVASLIIFGCGLYVALWAKGSVKNKNDIKLNTLISKKLNEISNDIVLGVGKYEYGLQGLRAAVNSVQLDKFTYRHNLDYSQSRQYDIEFPGSRGFGVIKKVNKNDLNSFLKYAEKDRSGPFVLKQLNNPQDTLFIIQYIEPEINNQQAVGLDIGSEQNRRSAAIKAAVSNTTQLTGPITLVQANNKQNYGFLLLLPIKNSVNASQSSNASIDGWVYAPLLIHEILDAVSELNINFRIDISDLYLDQEINFYNSDMDADVDSGTRLTNIIDIYGRKWQIAVSPTVPYVESLALTSPANVFYQILILSILLSVLVLFIGRNVSRRLDSLTRKLSYAAVVKNTTEAIVAVDKDFLILHWNTSAESLFSTYIENLERKREPLINWLKPYITKDTLVSYFKQVSRGETILNKSFEYKTDDVTTAKQLQVSFIPLMQNNEFFGATVSIIDVTKLVQLQNELENKNELLEQQVVEKSGEIQRKALFQTSVLNSSRTAIIATDVNGIITLLNQSALALLQLEASTTLDKTNITELLHSSLSDHNKSIKFTDWIKKQLERQSSTLVTFSPKNVEFDIPVNLTSSIILNEHGNETGYVFLAEDIRETLSLKRHVSLINSALDNSQDVLLWLDSKGVVLHLNEFANIQLGHNTRSLHEQSINQIMLFDDNESWDSVKYDINDNNRITLERYYQHSNGETIPMLISCCKLEIDNEIVYYLAAKNISMRLKEETKLKLALSKVDAASKSKTTFISQMSHELRTPLNITSGMLQMLELTVLNDIQRTSVDGAKQSMKHLTYIIDDIMDLSDAERGLLKLDYSEFILDDVLNDVGFQLSAMLADKPVEVHFDMDPDVPIMLMGDVKKLRKIILSIASNAVKFTLSGEVVININAQRAAGKDVTLLVAISDTGIGIETGQLSQIFELFSQSDNSSSRQYGGLGVGLTIAHQFVQLMGGDLTVESEINVGSTFSFQLPLVEVEASSKLVPAELAKPLNILLVDDNQTALNILGNTIKLLGWQVCVASNAEDAFTLFQQAIKDEHRFDLVLLDWKMPKTDGWQLAEKIRSITPIEEVPLVIMVSATSRQKLAEKASESKSALNGFITKPVTRTMLVDAISDAVSASQQKQIPQEIKVKGKPLDGKSILVVEDNPTNQLIAKTLLKSQGAEVVVAEGGLVALKELEQSSFDFVLMDIQMPDLDGYETTRRIRANEKYLSLPIYAMTANVSDSDKELCYQAGMDGHIGKPFQLNYVVEQILKETSGSSALKSASSGNKKLHQSLTDDVIQYCENKQIDIKTSLARFNYLTDLYKRSLELFVDDLKVDLVTLSAKSSEPLGQDTHILFHTMKSSAASLGFKDLYNIAKTIEQQIDDNALESDASLSQTQLSSVVKLMEQAVNDIEGLLNILLIEPLEISVVEGTVDLKEGFNVLYQDVAQFNMKAIDSYKNIASSLNSLSSSLCDELVQNLNKLQFTEAKVQLDALRKLIVED
ncbi:hypothetical protein GCM10008107_09560 [Psychrosphaera saromensis]|uniref:histidine kinase n=1 Tax=Psychrosphaera saromensis TaxID=716813 RepID=A0A2S7UUT7_9GAMM|nr:response regulator [Psychrosphaera saromensis]PQJ53754.1 hypothetical protein BTO11_08825 [Psychrosphaera saromensis]GHB62561.1 hypothetical protein GCM10008107_09560 [Psychrosphaera saromensis]GLQ15459.1 hypothetical protein GCM10007917_29140 [Psychrosphaera saromensis]